MLVSVMYSTEELWYSLLESVLCSTPTFKVKSHFASILRISFLSRWAKLLFL